MPGSIGNRDYINPVDKHTPIRTTGQGNTGQQGKIFSPSDLVFERLLKEQLGQKEAGELQFSKHAAARVEQRGIELTPGLLDGLKNAVEKARDKGAKDVVVIGQQGAFIVNVPNNTVVTTMAPNEMKNNIFTNIDSAVIL